MKKILLIFILIILVLIMTGCSSKPTISNDGQSNTIAYITYGRGAVIIVQVAEYIRVSSGWIKICTVDGIDYLTNEKNVLIKVEKEN